MLLDSPACKMCIKGTFLLIKSATTFIYSNDTAQMLVFSIHWVNMLVLCQVYLLEMISTAKVLQSHAGF